MLTLFSEALIFVASMGTTLLIINVSKAKFDTMINKKCVALRSVVLMLILVLLTPSNLFADFGISASTHKKEAELINKKYPADKYVLVSLGTSQASVEIFLEALGRNDLVRIPIIDVNQILKQFTWPSSTFEGREYSQNDAGKLYLNLIKLIEAEAGSLNGRKIVIIRRLYVGSTMSTFSRALSLAKEQKAFNESLFYMEAYFLVNGEYEKTQFPGFYDVNFDVTASMDPDRTTYLEEKDYERRKNMKVKPIHGKEFIEILMEEDNPHVAIKTKISVNPFQLLKYETEKLVTLCSGEF
jgi:hypothetical protein